MGGICCKALISQSCISSTSKTLKVCSSRAILVDTHFAVIVLHWLKVSFGPIRLHRRCDVSSSRRFALIHLVVGLKAFSIECQVQMLVGFGSGALSGGRIPGATEA